MQRGLPRLTMELMGQLIMIKTDFDRIVYGRVYMYDESTKTLILKVIDHELYQQNKSEQITGMGVYNAANCEFVGTVSG